MHAFLRSFCTTNWKKMGVKGDQNLDSALTIPQWFIGKLIGFLI